jgi:hypothetical protein
MDPALPGRAEQELAALDAEKAPEKKRSAGGWGGKRSGLAWMSGASGAGTEFESWRGRRLDVKTGYLTVRRGWREMTQVSFVRRIVNTGARPVLGVGLVPEQNRGQLGACAAGAFDEHIRKIGRGFVAAGAEDAILRLGWEANRMGDFAWAVTRSSGPEPYKGCFRRWVQVLRSVPGQRFVIDFNMGARGNLPYNQDRIYPGAEYVDVIGTQRYDRCPAIRDDGDWKELYNKRFDATRNPIGLGAWLAWAKSKGKRFSVPEWGVSDRYPGMRCPSNGFDNPFFIQKMYEFFQKNAGSMAYEAYFNGASRAFPDGVYKIYPAHTNPRAAERYRSLWSRGR